MGNVILTGFMGSGKTSVAVKLSYRLKRTVVDTDRWIEKKQGKTIKEIFEQDGEEAFRQMETEALRAIKESAKNEIVSVGGGTPLREENRALMKEIGTVVYLRAKPETIYDRVKEDKNRPLLQCEEPLEKIRELLEKRSSAYEAGADVVIDVDDKTFVQILFEIDGALRSREKQRLPGQLERPYRAGQLQYRAYRQEQTDRYPGQRNWIPRRQSSYAPLQETYGTRQAYGPDQSNFGTRQSYGPDRSDFGGRQSYGPSQSLYGVRQSYGPSQGDPGIKAAYGSESENRAEERVAPVSPHKLLVINGPNLNFLGIREKQIYGGKDYYELLRMIAHKAAECNVGIDVWQSNHEGAIIDRLQQAYFDGTEGIVINPGAYTHYSYAIRDALSSITVPKVEVHISNIMEREEFRHVSVTAPACDKQIYGQGLEGYLQAIDYLLQQKES